jgi:hypothetical protein
MRAHAAVLASRKIILIILIMFVFAALREVLRAGVSGNSVASCAGDNIACEEQVDGFEGDAWKEGVVSFCFEILTVFRFLILEGRRCLYLLSPERTGWRIRPI